MILTCPSCATRYFVKDNAVPSGGRPVRCASCGTEWRAALDAPPLELTPAPSDTAPGRPPPLPKAYRAKVAAKRQTREAVAVGVVWAGLALLFVAVALAAVLFRVDVVKAFPRANAAYAAARMPVNPTGLALEGVQGGPGLENGRQVLLVTGSLRNIEAAARAPAPLRVSIYDKAGHRAVAQFVTPAGGVIAPGEARVFRAVFYDPPLNAAEFGVDFAWDVPVAAGAAHGKAGAHTPAVSHAEAAHAPAPAAAHGLVAEAKALPSDSPYALHAAAETHAPEHAEH